MRGDVTQILEAIERGDAGAAHRLLPLVYDELRSLASRRLARERPGQTLQATALVHEAWLRLIGPKGSSPPAWEGQGHFFAAAAEAMRRILIDRARAGGAIKRGGRLSRLRLDPGALTLDAVPSEIIDLDQALTRLAAEDPGAAALVQLRFFAGLSLRRAAAVLGIPSTTAERRWTYARAWLYKELSGTC